MTIPFLDITAAYKELQGDLDAAILRVARSGVYVLGEEVSAFEREWAEYCGARFCVGVGNGLDALELALRAVGVRAGDEVLVPAQTFIATWLAVVRCGATPVPVDVEIDSSNIDASLIRERITRKTRAVVVVHLFGRPANLTGIHRLAQEFDLRVVEDAAQAHGAIFDSQRIGGLSDATAWSFYPGKNLGALGDGGAVTTNLSEVADQIRLIRNYGSPEKYVHSVIGVNSRLDPIQAAVLRVKLRVLDDWNKRRAQLAEIYFAELSGFVTQESIEPSASAAVTLSSPRLQSIPHLTQGSVWHLYVIRVTNREGLRSRLLSEYGIETLIHYPLLPMQQEAFCTVTAYDTPVAEELAAQSLSLPLGPHMTEQQVVTVSNAVKEIAFA